MTQASELPSWEELHGRINVDYDKGLLLWRPARLDDVRGMRPGEEICPIPKKDGYKRFSWTAGGEERKLMYHRVIWKMRYIEEPPQVMDHINGDKSDNRIINLRPANKVLNMANTAPRYDRRFKGVYKSRRRWKAEVRVSGTTQYLGTFDAQELAARAVDDRMIELYGPYARLNFPTEADVRTTETIA